MSPRGLGLTVAIARQYNSRLFHGFLHRSRAKPIAYSFCYQQMTRIHPSKPSAFHVLLEWHQLVEGPVSKADSHTVVSSSLKAIEPVRSRPMEFVLATSSQSDQWGTDRSVPHCGSSTNWRPQSRNLWFFCTTGQTIFYNVIRSTGWTDQISSYWIHSFDSTWLDHYFPSSFT